MSTENTTAIVLPKKAKKSVVIAALVERARIKHQEERAKLEAEHNQKQHALAEAVRKHLMEKLDTVEISDVSVNRASIYVGIGIDHVPPHIKALDDELNSLPSLGSFDSAQVKASIIAHLASKSPEIASVKAMLADQETVKNLDSLLEGMACKF